MRKLAIAVATLAMAALATPALAQGAGERSTYANLGYSWLDLDNGQQVEGITARGGYRFHQNFAAEAEITSGVADDNFAELDNAWGIYGVGILPITENLSAFGRVGYQQLNVTGINGGPDIEEDGAGYGVGAEWRFANNFGVRADYTRLDNADADIIGVSGSLSF